MKTKSLKEIAIKDTSNTNQGSYSSKVIPEARRELKRRGVYYEVQKTPKEVPVEARLTHRQRKALTPTHG